MGQRPKDTLPDTVAGCDLELRSISEALPTVSSRSREHMLTRSDRLLDRRLLLQLVLAEQSRAGGRDIVEFTGTAT